MTTVNAKPSCKASSGAFTASFYYFETKHDERGLDLTDTFRDAACHATALSCFSLFIKLTSCFIKTVIRKVEELKCHFSTDNLLSPPAGDKKKLMFKALPQ